jgi:hypothetical protein
MGLTTPELALWYASMLLELIVCALAFRRRLYKQLPIFTSYTAAVLIHGVPLYLVYREAGYTSRLAFYFFWITQAGLLVFRGAVIGELAWSASRAYLGLRAVMKSIVTAICSILSAIAVWYAVEVPSRLPAFVLALERDLELTAAVVLLALFFLTSYYDASFGVLQKRIAIGLFVYSLLQVINNAVSKETLQHYFHWWNVVRLTSFHVALLIWLIALLKPVEPEPAAEAPPDLEPVRAFVKAGAEVMRDLLRRVTRFRKGRP